MDPVALTPLITSATKFAVQIALAIRGTIQEVRQVDDHLSLFLREVDGLRGVLNSITTTLNDPGLAEVEAAGEENKDMWSAILEAVDNCHTTLEQLWAKIVSVHHQQGKGPGLWGQVMRALKLHLEKDEIEQIRSHLHIHQTSLGTSLQMLQVYISCRLPSRLQTNLDQKFDDLSRKISSLGLAIESGKSVKHIESSLATTAYSGEQDRTSLVRLKKAAEKVRSDASNKSVARSSTIARTRASIYSEYASTVEPLSDGTRHEIARWNSTSSPSTSEPGRDQRRSDILPRAVSAVELPADGTDVVTRGSTESQAETVDSDFEIDLNITQSWASKGDFFFRQRLYAKAAECYKNAKQRSGHLNNSSHMQQELQQIGLRLAWSHLRTSHFDECQRTLEDLLKPRSRTTIKSHVPLFATFLLSLLMILRARYDEAERHCRHALKDCRAIEGRDSFWYNKMLHHLALTHMAKNEIVESTAVFHMLPPKMRPPRVDQAACAAVRSDFKNANRAPTDPCRLENLSIYLFPSMSNQTDTDAREAETLRQGSMIFELPASKSTWSRKMADAQRKLGFRGSEASSDGGRPGKSAGKSLFGHKTKPEVSPWSPVYPIPQPDVAELPSGPQQTARPVTELAGDFPVPVELPAPVPLPNRPPRRSAENAAGVSSPVSPAVSAVSRTSSRPDRPAASRNSPNTSTPQTPQLRRKNSLPLAFDTLIQQRDLPQSNGQTSQLGSQSHLLSSLPQDSGQVSSSASSGLDLPSPLLQPLSRRDSASSHSTISRLTIGEDTPNEQDQGFVPEAIDSMQDHLAAPEAVEDTQDHQTMDDTYEQDYSLNARAEDSELLEASQSFSPTLQSILRVAGRSEMLVDPSGEADASEWKRRQLEQAQAKQLENARLSLLHHVQMLNK